MKQQVFLLQWICILCVGCKIVMGKRGPHHPKSEKRHKLDEHLMHEKQHIKEDLEEYALGSNKDVDVDNMTEEEKSFYYFKIHDTDNNDFLDGLEMLHAATHRGAGHFHKMDRMNELEKFEDELIHIVDVIDEFIEYADLNNDGFLNYPEYVKAIAMNEDNKNQIDKVEPVVEVKNDDQQAINELEEEEEAEEEEEMEAEHNHIVEGHIDDL